MGTKTIRLDEEVYERVKAHKREGETYSEAIDRLIGGWSLLDLTGTMGEKEAREHEAAIRASENTGVDDVAELLEREETTDS